MWMLFWTLGTNEEDGEMGKGEFWEDSARTQGRNDFGTFEKQNQDKCEQSMRQGKVGVVEVMRGEVGRAVI